MFLPEDVKIIMHNDEMMRVTVRHSENLHRLLEGSHKKDQGRVNLIKFNQLLPV